MRHYEREVASNDPPANPGKRPKPSAATHLKCEPEPTMKFKIENEKLFVSMKGSDFKEVTASEFEITTFGTLVLKFRDKVGSPHYVTSFRDYEDSEFVRSKGS